MGDQYNFSDFVKFRKGDGFSIGKIENFSREENWFEYFEYILSEELPTGRQAHHGTNEVFKTEQMKRGLLTDIVEKTQVSKLSEYLIDRKGYVMRQQFFSKELLPQLKQCFCNQFVNPDQVLILCTSCEKPFHAECISHKLEIGSANCDQCRTSFQNNQIAEKLRESFLIPQRTPLIQEKQQRPESSRAIQIEEEEEEEVVPTRENKIDLNQIIKKVKIDHQNSKSIPIKTETINGSNKSKQQQIQIETEPTQQQQKQQFKNISSSAVDRMKNCLEKYRQMENVNGHERKRQEVREKFFSVIFYGIEELREIKDQDQLTNIEKEILQQNDNSLFQTIKNLALDIEVFAHIKFNNTGTKDSYSKQQKLDPSYVERCKLIYLHLKDDKNLELRRKVINKEFSAQDLCIRDERDLYNPERRKQIQETAIRAIALNAKDKEDERKPSKEIEEIPKINAQTEEIHTPALKRETSSRTQALQDRIAEYTIEKSLQRFKKRIEDELNEKERVPLLANLEQWLQQQ